MNSKDFINWCKNQHDVVCNQKYNDTLPYSFHLDCVWKQAFKFQYLIPINSEKMRDELWFKVLCSAYGHDLYEDARVTFNQVKDMVGEEVAEIIYLCTELRGRTRAQRKNTQFYMELKENKLAVFVKLCDIIANVKFSLLTNSSMYDKYKAEYVKIYDHLFTEEYKEMFDYLEALLKIN